MHGGGDRIEEVRQLDFMSRYNVVATVGLDIGRWQHKVWIALNSAESHLMTTCVSCVMKCGCGCGCLY
jgi:hypothetical protein